jgi:hypothetical protein
LSESGLLGSPKPEPPVLGKFSRLAKKLDSGKLDQAIVLYMTAAEIGKSKGAHCDDCRMFIGKDHAIGKCGAVEGPINGETGVCGLYVFGEPNQLTKSGTLSKETAGYIDNGPTHCASCEYFQGVGSCEKVQSTPSQIEDGGCCNHWEAA